MKIMLINPSQHSAYGKLSDVPVFFPIGLGYLGAVLEKNGHEVDIIDMDGQKIAQSGLTGMLRGGGYGLIGITATSPVIMSALKLARSLKAATDIPVVFGGVHPSLFAEHVLGDKSVDYVVRGEGEETILELAENIKKGAGPEGIKGLSFRRGKDIVHNEARSPIADLDKIPFPVTHALNSTFYTYPNALMKRIAPILTSRGCPGSCTYCCTRKMFGHRIRYRSAGNVLEEMIYLKEKLGIQEVHIWDDNFITKKDFVTELGRLIKEERLSLKICLPNGVRVDFFTEEMARHLKDMGVYSLSFGIESGNQKVLDGVRKGIRLETSRKAVSIAKKFGFETWGFFMFGLPDDDERTINETIDFSLELDPDIAKFHILKPFPGTEVHEELHARGLLSVMDFDEYSIHSRPVHRLPGLSADDMERLKKKAYRKFYLRPGKIFRQIGSMKSVERVKFNVKAAFNMFKILKGDV